MKALFRDTLLSTVVDFVMFSRFLFFLGDDCLLEITYAVHIICIFPVICVLF